MIYCEKEMEFPAHSIATFACKGAHEIAARRIYSAVKRQFHVIMIIEQGA